MKEEIKITIVQLARKRGLGKTICPSEIARSIFPSDTWRDHMDDVRQVAFELVEAGQIEVTQRGQVISPVLAKGPIRLRLKRE